MSLALVVTLIACFAGSGAVQAAAPSDAVVNFWESKGFDLSSGNLVYMANFDDGDLGDANANQFCCTHSYALDSQTVREGNYSLRLLLKRSDPLVLGGHRAEISHTSQEVWAEYGREYLYSTSVFIPNAFQEDDANAPDVILQWWPQPDPNETYNRSSALNVSVAQNEWVIEVHWDTRPMTPATYPKWEGMVQQSTPLQKGQWTEWHVYARWAYDNSGILRIWKNNELVFSRAGAPNTYNDQDGVTAKLGVYKWPWKQDLGNPGIAQRQIYIDEHYTWKSHASQFIQDSTAALDFDGDQILDFFDNCTLQGNADQIDSNGDGFGNACDPDLNNDNVVDFSDPPGFLAAFFSQIGDPNWNPDADITGDGVVDFGDLAIMQSLFFAPPGPSGLVP